MYEYICLNDVWNGVKYMQTRRTPISCGANQLYNLDVSRRSLEKLLVNRYQRWSDRKRPGSGQGFVGELPREIQDRRTRGDYDNKVYGGETVIFSDADENGNAEKLVRYIKAHDLGEVVSLSTSNPNTRNKITTYLWVYNGNALKDERLPREKVQE